MGRQWLQGLQWGPGLTVQASFGCHNGESGIQAVGEVGGVSQSKDCSRDREVLMLCPPVC